MGGERTRVCLIELVGIVRGRMTSNTAMCVDFHCSVLVVRLPNEFAVLWKHLIMIENLHNDIVE